jgi:hypothetical protein
MHTHLALAIFALNANLKEALLVRKGLLYATLVIHDFIYRNKQPRASRSSEL